ncbi:hypothetical protein CICLE_v10023155mg [Citrus x clementina]|uniref:Uncharacterized protein n=1 Tax=Citrus clementina TaxID=85681 RepID=V4VPT2_CITCL|nr:hypothetical protein CICLE_v10023155mg [Citrus x clementina]
MSLSDKYCSKWPHVSFLHCLSPVAKIMPKNYALVWLIKYNYIEAALDKILNEIIAFLNIMSTILLISCTTKEDHDHSS